MSAPEDAERELRLSLEQNSVILKHIADAVTAQDATGRVVYANDAARRLLGVADPGEFKGADAGALAAAFEMLDENGEPFESRNLPGNLVLQGADEARAVIRWRRRDTRDDRWTVVQAKPVRDDSGRVILAINILHDITERRRAEQRMALLSEVSGVLTSSLDFDETVERVVRLMVPALGDWSVLHVIDGEQVRWSACHRNALLDAKLRELSQTPVPLSKRNVLPETLFNGRAVQLSYEDDAAMARRIESPESVAFVRSLGTRSAICAPLVVRGVSVGALSVMSAQSRRYGDDELHLLEDVAHRAALAVDNARVYRRAQLAAEQRRDLVAVVAHDLKNPLNAVTMAATLLHKGAAQGPAGDRARRQTTIIARASDRMNRLIHDLLDVSAIDAGRLEIEPGSCTVGSLVAEAVESMQPLAQEKTLLLERSVAPDLEELSVQCDRERVLQIFSNLIGNAIKFTDAGRAIRVSAERTADSVRFAVADEGAGIAAEHVAHLFDRFWRVRGRKRDGTGLGLWIVKGLVEAHGGRVSVETRLDAGSVFAFTLPLTL